MKDKIILDTNFNPYRKVETLNRTQLLDEKDSLDIISDSVFSMRHSMFSKGGSSNVKTIIAHLGGADDESEDSLESENITPEREFNMTKR